MKGNEWCTFPNVGVAFAAMFITAIGCGSPYGTVKGEVTYDGKPVQQGRISFYPESGKGPTTGGEIIDGRFEVTGMVPGQQKVAFTAHEVIETAKIGGDLSSLAPKRPGGRVRLFMIPKLLIKPNAIGNNQIVTVEKGVQKIDFTLEPAASKK